MDRLLTGIVIAVSLASAIILAGAIERRSHKPKPVKSGRARRPSGRNKPKRNENTSPTEAEIVAAIRRGETSGKGWKMRIK